MRVRHFALDTMPDSGGSSRYAFELSAHERKLGIDSKVIGFSKKQNTISRLIQNWKIRKSGIDVINIHYAGSFGILGIGLLPIKFSKIKVVSTFHGPWHLEAKLAGKSKYKVLMAFLTQQSVTRASDSIITLSRAFEFYAKKFSRKRIIVQPPGIDSKITHPNHYNLKFKKDKISICIVRRLVPRMGVDLAISALNLLPNKYELQIVGDGPERDNLVAQTFKLGLDSRVKFLGHISDSDLEDVLLNSDLMLVPSRDLEGYGMVVLEAYARCLAVIATPVQGLIESIPAQFHVWALAENVSDEAIAERVLKLKIESLPSHSEFQSVLSRNSWDAVFQRILKEYSAK